MPDSHDISNESYAHRIWRHFEADNFARNGLRVVVALFIIAALAPFLANSHAIIRVADGHVTFPIFPSLEPIEWRFLLYVPLAGIIYLCRRVLLRVPRADLGLFVLLGIITTLLWSVMPVTISINPGFLFSFSIRIAPVVWPILLYGALLFFVLRSRPKFFRLPQINLTFILLLILAIEITLALSHPVNDPSNDRDRAATFKVMPLIPYSPIESTPDSFSPPSLKHLCGTDSTGRDIAARMLHGARTSLSIGFIAQSIALLVGVTLGGLAGYYRGWFDIGVCRFIEIMDCFPPLLLILVAISLFESQNNMFYIMAVIGLTSWTGLARLVRGEFLRLSSQPFPQAARALGASDFRVIVRHLLPNALGPILVSATFGVASAILIESSLSFLGFGMQAPTPSWGDILSDARRYIDFAWWLAFFPGLAILITIMSYNFVGEGLRDAVDPRLKVK
jgi:peptide/nickel transport system permease protein